MTAAISILSSRASFAIILVLLPVVLTHGVGNENHNDTHGGMYHSADQPGDDSGYPPTYFAHAEHIGVIYAHIALMILSWVFVLPVGEFMICATPEFHAPTIPHHANC